MQVGVDQVPGRVELESEAAGVCITFPINWPVLGGGGGFYSRNKQRGTGVHTRKTSAQQAWRLGFSRISSGYAVHPTVGIIRGRLVSFLI